MTKHYCAQCKAGEIYSELATVYVEGKIQSSYSDRYIPYKAYLCNDHLELLSCDGAVFTLNIEVIQGYTMSSLNTLTRRYTAYSTFSELCRNNPTLRPDAATTRKTGNEMRILKTAYENAVTERSA